MIETELINNGFVEPVVKPDDYIHGSGRSIAVKLGQVEEVLRPDGQWDGVNIPDELQNRGFETFNCTSFNSLAQLELYMKVKYNL